MKTPSSLIIPLSFLLWFSITTTKPSSLASAEEVVDLNGQPLVPGEAYIITSATWGAGAGVVSLARTGDSSCSYSVISESPLFQRGAPVKFRVKGTSTDKISVGSTHLEIEFVDKPNCAESSKWVASYQPGSAYSWLVIGGSQDHPNSKLISGVFKIEKVGIINYKLVFCPKNNVVRPANSCYDVGRESDNGYVRLAVNSSFPFMILFEKVKDYDNGKSVIRMKPE